MHVGLEYRHPGVVHSVEQTGQPVPDGEYGENIPAVKSRSVVSRKEGFTPAQIFRGC